MYKPKTVWGIVKNTKTPLDGLKLILTQWDYDNYENWHLTSWLKEDDYKVMQTMHNDDELYANMPIEEFEVIWKSGEYEPPGSYCFELDAVDVVEIINEEISE